MDMSQNLDAPRRPAIVEAQTAVRSFLETALPEVRRVNVTKVAPVAVGQGDAGRPKPTSGSPTPRSKPWSLHTDRPVLDHSRYLIRLDALLNVLEYEFEGSADKRVL